MHLLSKTDKLQFVGAPDFVVNPNHVQTVTRKETADNTRMSSFLVELMNNLTLNCKIVCLMRCHDTFPRFKSIFIAFLISFNVFRSLKRLL